MDGEKIAIQPQLDYYDLGQGVTAFSSTRRGGFSKGRYAEFNINNYCGDNSDDISMNRKALCMLLGIADDRLVMPHQVHRTSMARIDNTFLALSTEERQQQVEGFDAIMTNVNRVCIGVSTADCIPILVYDEEHRAVCAIHAGWRGTVARIAQKSIAAMTEAYGSCPERLKAQIGPGIGLDSFEVGNEVYEAFEEAGFDMTSISRKEEKWHIDLPRCNRQQLMTAGIPPQSISVADTCTVQHADRYFSARKLGIESGRIFSGIMLT